MKTPLFASLVIGLLISVVLHAMPSLGDGKNPLFEVPIPGAAAAFIFWGMLGGSTSAGLHLATIVNGVMYAAMVFVVLSLVLSVLRLAIDMTKR